MSAAAKPRPVLPKTAKVAPKRTLTFDPEFDLLLACCTTEPSGDHIQQLLSSQIDWNRWLSLLDHHRVIPQVYRALAGLCRSMPDDTFIALQSSYQENARKALWFTGELVRLVGHLESLGIKTLIYKGPALAKILYGEVTQRQFCDLDILVRPVDVPRARVALLDLGYKSQIELTLRQERDYIDSGYEYAFRNRDNQNLLELQWKILPRFYSVDFDATTFFDRAGEIHLGGSALATLRPSDLMLVLCVHAAKHMWCELSLLCDIAQLASSPRLNWNTIHSQARRLGIERVLLLNLLLANLLLGARLPFSIQQMCRQTTTITTLANEIQLIIARNQHYDAESIPYFRFMIRLRERPQDRARLLARLIFTPSLREWSTIRLPE